MFNGLDKFWRAFMNIKKNVQIRWGKVLLSLLFSLFLAGIFVFSSWYFGGQTALAGNSIDVNSTADDTLANLALNTTCDLREAIVAANTNAAVGQCNPSGLAVDGINIIAKGSITLTDDLPMISDDLFLTGPGVADLEIGGMGLYRHFKIAAWAYAEISEMMLSDGYQYSDSSSSKPGGSILNYGELYLDNMIIIGNEADADNGYSGNGGAIYTTGKLTLRNSQVSYNRAATDGGAVYVDFSSTCEPPTTTVRIVNTIISNNVVNGKGGGIYIDASGCIYTDTLFIDSSEISANEASNGAGIFYYEASGKVNNSTFSGNSASTEGGAIATNANSSQMIGLDNVTIANNSATNAGGGLQVGSNYLVALRNTIVADNSTSINGPDVWGNILSNDYNLIEDTTGANITGSTLHNITGKDPKLGPLTYNGAWTSTQALLYGSPAIDSGSCTDSYAQTIWVDQRNFNRVLPCDIGAYENQNTDHVFIPFVVR